MGRSNEQPICLQLIPPSRGLSADDHTNRVKTQKTHWQKQRTYPIPRKKRSSSEGAIYNYCQRTPTTYNTIKIVSQSSHICITLSILATWKKKKGKKKKGNFCVSMQCMDSKSKKKKKKKKNKKVMSQTRKIG